MSLSPMILLKGKKTEPYMVDIDKRVKAFVDVFCAPVPIAGQVVTRTKRERSTTPVYDVTPWKNVVFIGSRLVVEDEMPNDNKKYG